MIIPLVLSPNLFDEEAEHRDSSIADKLALLLRVLQEKGLIVFDKENTIETAMLDNIESITNQTQKIKLKKILIFLKKLKTVNLDKQIVETELNPTCENVLSLLKNSPDIVGITLAQNSCTKTCKECYQELFGLENPIIDINNIDVSFIDKIIRTNFVSIKEYDENKLKRKIFDNLIKYSTEISIYDNQMIPLDRKDLSNKQKYKIKENYEFNLKYLFNYMYSINPDLKINLFLVIKQEQQIIKDIIYKSFDFLVTEIKKTSPNININLIEILEECGGEKETKLLHERYFMSDLITISCDRGVDIINYKTHEVKDFNISIINYFNWVI